MDSWRRVRWRRWVWWKASSAEALWIGAVSDCVGAVVVASIAAVDCFGAVVLRGE